jgi:hypothetical protein
MNVSGLYELTNWIQSEIEGKQIPKKYQALQQVLQRNAQPNQQKQPFENQKDDLIKTIRKVPLNQLTKDQVEFLRNLGIAQTVGKEGVDTIEDILYKNVLDIATAAKKIQEIHQRLTQGIQKSNQIKTGLQGCVKEQEYEAKEEVLIRVYFKENASLENVTDFKKWGNIWYEIGRGIAMVHNAAPENVRIVGATSGSIVIEMAAVASIASTTSIIILSALKVAERVIDILKKVEELRNLKLNNEKLLNELEKEARKEKETGINKIADEIIRKLGLNSEGEGDKINALKKSVTNLVNFIESGGEVDFIIPEQDLEESQEAEGTEKLTEGHIDYTKIKETARQIRELGHKMKALEGPADHNEDD